jgi:hypothetical protein
MTADYFCSTGGAVFSADAPGWAGTLLEGAGAGEDGKGGVTWATCALPATIRANETPDIASPPATSAVASSICRREARFPSSGDISVTACPLSAINEC